MKRGEKLHIIMVKFYGWNKTDTAKKLGISRVTLDQVLSEKADLSFSAIDKLSEYGINAQWYINDEFAISAFNTSYKGILLSQRFPEFAATVRNKEFKEPLKQQRIRAWLDKYAGGKQGFFAIVGEMDEDTKSLWDLKLRGRVHLEISDYQTFYDIGINSDYILCKSDEELKSTDEFSDSLSGLIMRQMREDGKEVVHPSNLDSATIIAYAQRFLPADTIRRIKEQTAVESEARRHQKELF